MSVCSRGVETTLENNMIHNNLGEDYETWRKTVETFANKEVAPVIGDLYERHAFPYDIVAKMAEMGMFALPFDEEYGGSGGDLFAVCLAVEELARASTLRSRSLSRLGSRSA